MPTIRRQLADAAPPVSMKAAWRAFLQALRAQGRATGQRGEHHDRARLERTLDRDLPACDPAVLGGIKADLRTLLHGQLDDAARGPLAARVDAALAALAPRTARGPVSVRVTGWPPGLTRPQQALLAGHPLPAELPAEEAAALVRALDGLVLGGRTLSVEVDLPAGEVLPAVPRDRRDRSARAGSRAWLPHLDEQGAHSLTPRDLALAQADLLPADTVVDAFCGCGGNALALAMRKRRVVAIERDPGRAALARRNATALGLDLDLRVGDAAALLADIGRALPGAGLLLDPPWGGAGHSQQAVTWDALVPLPAEIFDVFGPVLLKAPRAFDPDSLPASRGWTWRYELGPPGADGRATVLALTCLGVQPLVIA